MKPLESILGKNGTEPQCNQFIHWFKSSKPGAKCLCGKTTQEARRKPKDKPCNLKSPPKNCT